MPDENAIVTKVHVWDTPVVIKIHKATTKEIYECEKPATSTKPAVIKTVTAEPGDIVITGSLARIIRHFCNFLG